MTIIDDAAAHPVGVCTRCGALVSTSPEAKAVHDAFHAMLESAVWSASGGGSYSLRIATVDYDGAVGNLEDSIRGRN